MRLPIKRDLFSSPTADRKVPAQFEKLAMMLWGGQQAKPSQGTNAKSQAPPKRVIWAHCKYPEGSFQSNNCWTFLSDNICELAGGNAVQKAYDGVRARACVWQQ